MGLRDTFSNEKLPTTLITGVSIVIIAGYLLLNWRTLVAGNNRFIFTTIGVFVWLCLVMLYMIYEICEDLKKEMGFNVEDNLVEIRLLKELTEKQLNQMNYFEEALKSSSKKRSASPPKKTAKKKR